MIQRNDGTIAVKWVINPNGKTVQIDGTDQYYVFTPKNHVVLAWVQPDHVDRLLTVRQKTCNCNNGTFRNAFELANLLDVNIWTWNSRDMGVESDYQEIADAHPV